ncbi:hypothetical protein CKAH01_06519 [Colletotrichum kahawae]|uniref:Uncharacterized protein n=1 Tax=Colletotrichum kahawae TaxID=34407 RepID=A0AAE0D3U3_COLKA|nr:hypothetical protein CKAH01_06519 [Colletotrichum kahawae]
MAQERMPELTELIRGIYHRFPSETWERTRTLLDHHPPHHLFAHVEDLIAPRAVDHMLRSDAAFRRIAADFYGLRHPWLRDADLGQARWEEYGEFTARSAAAEVQALTQTQTQQQQRDPAAAKRALLLRKIREGGDVERWRRVLGLEDAVFSEAEIRGGQIPAFGRGEVRVARGEEIGACIDGPGGEYGPETWVRAAAEEKVAHVGVPRAPGDGGEGPRNPFTTGWVPRETPGGERFPDTFDPLFTSNQFIRRSKKYERPKMPVPDEDEDEEMAGEEGPEGMAGQAGITTLSGLRRGDSSTVTETLPFPAAFPGQPPRSGTQTDTGDVGSIQLIGGNTVPSSPARPLIPGFTISTRTDNPQTQHPVMHPSIVVTDTSSTTTHTVPLFGRISTMTTQTEAPPAQTPRIHTPWREELPPPPIPDDELPSPADDVEMADSDDDDAVSIVSSIDPASTTWLEDFLRPEPSVPASDLEMMSYRGWRIHSPRIQLIRIKNFLADEDVDRTIGWATKFAEVVLFLQHCMHLPDAEHKSWWDDLQEAIKMAHTHQLFEQHHYGAQRLVVDFPAMSAASTRLPQVHGGRGVVVEEPPPEPVRPRYLLHRVPESLHDVDYQIPAPLLRNTFLAWFREDGNLVWRSSDSDSNPGSGDRGKKFGYEPDFNMALTEDAWFGKCLAGGAATAAASLRGEANFYILTDEHVPGDVEEMTVNGATHKVTPLFPEGETQQRFARYRGAKRAALQLCLTHFDGVENVAIQGPFRKLVMPLTKRQKAAAREAAGEGIVYKPLAIEAPPQGAKVDPLGLTFWHQKMRESHYVRARATRDRTEEAHRRFLQQIGAGGGDGDDDIVLPPRNYLGPLTGMSYLTEGETDKLERMKMLNGLRDNLQRAYNRAPREMLQGVLKNIEFGFAGGESWDVRDELREHREKHGKYLPLNGAELFWMEWMCEPSTNVRAQRGGGLPALGREFEVFVARMEGLLGDMDMGSLLAKAEDKVDVGRVTEALNVGLREGDYELKEDVVGRFCKVLSEHGRLGYEADNGTIAISRPNCDWHPEHRVYWPTGSDPWDPHTNIYHRTNLPDPLARWTWQTAFDNIMLVDATRRVTKTVLWALAYRVGVELDGLTRDLTQVREQLRDASAWDRRAVGLQDVAGQWRNHFERHGRVEDDGLGPPVSYVSVVRAGDPAKWAPGMTEPEAYEVVRRGVIDELSEGKSTLWPSRPRFSKKREGGREVEVATLHRDRVWDWAAPEVAGRKGRFFSVNRWPVHLQSEKTQEKIRNSKEEAERAREKEREAVQERLARLEEESRPTEAELQQREFDRMLSVPYHEGDDRTEFFPSAEYWGGDTRLQRRAVEAHVRGLIAEEMSPNDGRAPRGRAQQGSGDVSLSRISLPEVNSPDVPHSVPGFLSRGWNPFGSTVPQARNEPAAQDTERVSGTSSPVYSHDGEPEEAQRRVHFEDEG